MREYWIAGTSIIIGALVVILSFPSFGEDEAGRSVASAQLTAIPVRDIQTGLIRLGKDADESENHAWIKERLRKFLKDQYHESLSFTEEQLQGLSSGNTELLAGLSPGVSQSVYPIISGDATLSHSVGMLLQRPHTDNGTLIAFIPVCTVALTGPNTVITAEHCVHEKAEAYKVYFPFEGIRQVSPDQIRSFCDDHPDGCDSTIDDLAIITFSSPYIILPPLPPPQSYLQGLTTDFTTKIVGYGYDSFNADNELTGFGIMRDARVVLKQCAPCTYLGLDDEPSFGGRRMCFSYDEVNPYSNAGYDSGGPMLFTCLPQGPPMVGVASSKQKNCFGENLNRSSYVDIRHDAYNAWTAGAFCSSGCSTDSDDVIDTLLSISLDHIDAGDDIKTYTDKNIRQFAKKLIVTLNHEADDSMDLALELPSSLHAVCDRNHAAEVCVSINPPAGDYNIAVKRINGNPAFQLTAITINCPGLSCWLDYLRNSMIRKAVPGQLQLNIEDS